MDHDNQDPLNNRKGENRKKCQKDVGEPSLELSRRNKSPMVHAEDDTPAIQPIDQEDDHIRTRSNPEWYTKSGLANAMRKTTWFDLLLKSDIDQNENHILRPSTMAIAKKLKAILEKDKLTIVDLEEAKWNSDENDVSKPRSFERHMSKNTKPHPSFYNNDFYYLCKETYSYLFEALNGIHHWQDNKINFFKVEMSTRKEGKIYSDLRIKSLVRIEVKKKWGYGFLTSIVVRRSDDQEYEFSYADLPRLSLNDVEDMYRLQV
ncbi:hypothetical protein Tco_0316140 [Tanacetum coccineum]